MPQTTGFTVWLTGMSLTGKSTLATFLAERLRAAGRRVEIIDADEVALLLANGEGLTKDERNLVTRRLGYVAKVLTRNDCVAVVAAVSPYRESRDAMRKEIGRFIEVFVDCPTEKLIERDTTGRYKKALAGELPNFTGVTDPYETPQHAEVTVETDAQPVEVSGGTILQSLFDIGYLKPEEMKAMTGKRARKTVVKPAKPAKEPKARKADAKAPKAAPAARARPAAKPVEAKKAAKPQLARRQPAKPVKPAKKADKRK